MFVDISDVAPPKRVLLKIVILGDTGVGKTALLNQFVHRRFEQRYKATIGADFVAKTVAIDEKLVTLQIWDTAGQERFHSLGVAFYRGADCCILVYDINAVKSFGTLEKWADDFLKQSGVDNPETFPFMLLGNKSDVDAGTIREVSEKQAREWCKSSGNIPYYETSAKDGRNVDAAFLDIATIALAMHEKDIYNPTILDQCREVLGEPSTANNNSSCAC